MIITKREEPQNGPYNKQKGKLE